MLPVRIFASSFSDELNFAPLNVSCIKLAFVRLILLLCFAMGAAHSAHATVTDSTRRQIISLDSLSDEDYALLLEYRDSFMKEAQQIKKTLNYRNRKPIDTSVASMNLASHVEIGFNANGPVLSNGRASGLSGTILSPSVMYYHKTGLYAVMGMNFFTDSTIRHSAKVPSLYISPGFYRTFYKRWSFGLSYARNFIFYGLPVQRGMLNNSFSVFNSFNFWNYIALSVNIGISWSSNLYSKKFMRVGAYKVYYKTITTDAGQGFSANIGINLQKDFSFYNVLGAKVFTITPDLYLLFGKDNSTLITRAINRPGIAITADRFFGLLDIEPGFALQWRIRNLGIFGAFHCAIPFNEYNSDAAARIKNPRQYYPYGEGGIKYLFTVIKKRK